MKTLVVLGAGGHGKVVAEAAATMASWQQILFLDDQYPELQRAAEFEVVGKITDLEQMDRSRFSPIVAIGNNKRRLQLLEHLQVSGWEIATIVHATAWLSPSAITGVGTVLFAGAVVNAEAVLGMGAIVNTGATVDHDCQLGSAVHVSPGAHLGGGVVVGEFSWVGIGACVRQQIVLGREVTVGAGAAVVTDVPDGQTVIGVPAKPMLRE